jgi:hypothetical protein
MGTPGDRTTGDPWDLNSDERYKLTSAHGNTVADNEIHVFGAKDRFAGPAFFGLNPGSSTCTAFTMDINPALTA